MIRPSVKTLGVGEGRPRTEGEGRYRHICLGLKLTSLEATKGIAFVKF